MLEQEKPQVEPEDKVAVAGAEPPQPEAEPTVPQPGVEPTVAPPLPKTYTEEEFRGQMARFQAETAQAREVANRLAMDQQIKATQEAERHEAEKDRQAVEQGVITEAEAGQRKALREETVRLQQTAIGMQQFIRQQAWQGESYAKITIAHDLAKEYGINPALLLSDPTLTSPLAMVQKASKLAIANLKAGQRAVTPESFDKGPAGTLTKGTSADRIIRAYGEGDSGVTRAAYEKAMQDKGLL